MPLVRPTPQELLDRAIADIEANLPGTDARTRRSNLDVLARVHRAGMHELYGYLEWLSQQIIYDTAEAEILERWCNIWGLSRIPASAATGNVTFAGTNGTVIPAGTTLTRSDGVEYITAADAIIAAGTAIAAATAAVAGATSNAVAATALNLTSPIIGINSAATVAAGGLAGGTDTEDDAALRTRLIARIQQPPHGGADFDYVTWAMEVAGVTRAWVYTQELGLGTVTVRFVRDDDVSLIPDAGKVAIVQAYIDARRPVTADVTVVAPVAVALNFSIGATPNTTSVKDAITTELTDLLRREAIPGGTILLSHIREAISLAAGETNYTMTVPAADVTHTVGQMATMGVITWL